MMMSVKDYSRAISLWGGGQGEVISLLFRGMRTRGDRQKEREREREREREGERETFFLKCLYSNMCLPEWC
jgi:hypothetical protein